MYNVLFMYFLLIKQTQQGKKAKATDDILEKQVPDVVYVLNKKLLEAYEKEEERNQQIREEAQINEYLYYKSQEWGYSFKLDEDVGFTFLQIRPKSSVLG